MKKFIPRFGNEYHLKIVEKVGQYHSIQMKFKNATDKKIKDKFKLEMDKKEAEIDTMIARGTVINPTHGIASEPKKSAEVPEKKDDWGMNDIEIEKVEALQRAKKSAENVQTPIKTVSNPSVVGKQVGKSILFRRNK